MGINKLMSLETIGLGLNKVYCVIIVFVSDHRMCQTHSKLILYQLKAVYLTHFYSRIETTCNHLLDIIGLECTVSWRNTFNTTRCTIRQLCF